MASVCSLEGDILLKIRASSFLNLLNFELEYIASISAALAINDTRPYT